MISVDYVTQVVYQLVSHNAASICGFSQNDQSIESKSKSGGRSWLGPNVGSRAVESGAEVGLTSGRSNFRRNSRIHGGGSDSFDRSTVWRCWHRCWICA